jgi:hypothetical protein
MTKTEAFRQFKENVLPGLKETYEKDGRVDMPARCEAWNNYTDMLCKDGEITSHQYNTWTNPF